MSDVFNANININATDNTKNAYASAAKNASDAAKMTMEEWKKATGYVDQHDKAVEKVSKRYSGQNKDQLVGAFETAKVAARGLNIGMIDLGTTMTATVVGAAAVAFSEFSKMQEAMTRVKNSTHATTEEMKEFKEEMEDISEHTGVNVKVLAAQFIDFKRTTGLALDDAKKAFKAVAEQAFVSGGDMKATLSAVGVAVNQMKVPIEEVPKLLDQWLTTMGPVRGEFAAFMATTGASMSEFGFKGTKNASDVAIAFQTMTQGLGGNAAAAGQALSAIWKEIIDKNQFGMRVFAQQTKEAGGTVGDVILELDRKIGEIAQGRDRSTISWLLFPKSEELRNGLTAIHDQAEAYRKMREEADKAKGAVKEGMDALDKDAAAAFRRISVAIDKVIDATGTMLEKFHLSDELKLFARDINNFTESVVFSFHAVEGAWSDFTKAVKDDIEVIKKGWEYLFPPKPMVPWAGPAAPSVPGGGPGLGFGGQPPKTKTPTPDWFKKYQHGGMVTEPTLAMLGEAGPEMVMPMGAGMGAPGAGQPPQQDIDRPDPAMAGLWRAIMRNRGYRPGIDPTAVMGGLPGAGGEGGWGAGGGRGGGGGTGSGGSGRGGSGAGSSGGGDTGAGGSGTDERATDEWLRGSETAELKPLGLLTDALKAGGGQLPEGTIGGPGGTGAGQGGTGAGGSVSGAARTGGGGAIYDKLLAAFQGSGIVGKVPKGGARFGITTGSAAEWARFGTAVASAESSFNPRTKNTSDPGGSFGVFQYAHGQVPGGNAYDVDASVKAFVRDSLSTARGGQFSGSILARRFSTIGSHPERTASRLGEAGKIGAGTGLSASGGGTVGAGGYTPYAPPSADSGATAGGPGSGGAFEGVGAANFFSGGRAGQMGMGMGHGDKSQMVTRQTALGPMQFNKYAADDMVGFVNALHAAGVPGLKSYAGTLNDRLKRGGKTWSEHAFANAIDFQRSQAGQKFGVGNPEMMAWAQQHPKEFQEMLSKYHMYSGARFGDPGHFEWSPAQRGTGRIQTASKPATPATLPTDHFKDKSWQGHPTHEQSGSAEAGGDHTTVDLEHIHKLREQMSKPIKTKVEIETPQHIETTRRTAARQTARWDRIAEDRHDRHRASANLGFA